LQTCWKLTIYESTQNLALHILQIRTAEEIAAEAAKAALPKRPRGRPRKCTFFRYLHPCLASHVKFTNFISGSRIICSPTAIRMQYHHRMLSRRKEKVLPQLRSEVDRRSLKYSGSVSSLILVSFLVMINGQHTHTPTCPATNDRLSFTYEQERFHFH
jgi:hypothetical protein